MLVTAIYIVLSQRLFDLTTVFSSYMLGSKVRLQCPILPRPQRASATSSFTRGMVSADLGCDHPSTAPDERSRAAVDRGQDAMGESGGLFCRGVRRRCNVPKCDARSVTRVPFRLDEISRHGLKREKQG
jgi:hypothetical protein